MLIDEKKDINPKFWNTYLLTKKRCKIVNKKHEKMIIKPLV